MKDVVLSITTNGSGAATVKAPSGVFGRLYAIEYIPGTLATGATVTITCNGIDGASWALLTLTSPGTSNLRKYPRDLVHDNSGTALTGTSGGDRTCPLLAGIPQVVVASGGATAKGKVVLYYED
jgi:hypothetical protein